MEKATELNVANSSLGITRERCSRGDVVKMMHDGRDHVEEIT